MATAERLAGSLHIEVIFSPASGDVDRVVLQMPPGSTVAQALALSGVVARHTQVTTGCKVGVWGRLAAPEQVLRDRDRVELYRPLQVDPKEARRLRYKGQRQARRVQPPTTA